MPPMCSWCRRVESSCATSAGWAAIVTHANAAGDAVFSGVALSHGAGGCSCWKGWVQLAREQSMHILLCESRHSQQMGCTLALCRGQLSYGLVFQVIAESRETAGWLTGLLQAAGHRQLQCAAAVKFCRPAAATLACSHNTLGL